MAGLSPSVINKADSGHNGLGDLMESTLVVRDWSLIMGRGGATKREGEAREVLPLRKGGGGGKSFSHAVVGAQKVMG